MVQDQSWGIGEYYGSGLQLYPRGCMGRRIQVDGIDLELGSYYLGWEA
jgi:hypothetical protein